MELYQGFQEHPGRAPSGAFPGAGTGTTGIGQATAAPLFKSSLGNAPTGGLGTLPSGGFLPADQARDYDHMLGEQQEYQDLDTQYGGQFKRALASLKGIR